MKKFIKAETDSLKGNVFDQIGSRWLLITAKDDKAGRYNAMTASWGCMGVLWNKPVCLLFVRPQRHTFRLMEENEVMSVNILEDGNRSAYGICGSKSGRDTDKIGESGLIPVDIDGVCAFEQSELVLSLRKLYVSDLKEDSFLDKAIPESVYGTKDFHRVYICEITGAYIPEQN